MNFCECTNQGRVLTHCPHYNRDMAGRMRQICAGIDCDLGTAAAFREQWKRESASGPVGKQGTLRPPGGTATPLLLKTDQAPGDAVAMTAAIYSLHKAHPGKYITAVESPYPEVFAYNPDVAPITAIPRVLPFPLPLQMHYPAIHQSNERGIHFMQGWCEHLSSALGIQVPLLTNRPRLYFDTSEPPVQNYWVVCSGGKKDFTNKLWGYERYQEVVNQLWDEGVNFVQVGGSKPTIPWNPSTIGSQEDEHPPLINLYKNMVGMTTLRELFEIVRWSRGVVCGVSLLMHVAAALEKPAIIIAGGREPVQWNAYPKQHYLHTVGVLGCSDPNGNVGGACWRSRTVPLGDMATLDEHPCLRPIGPTPECMTLIKPSTVAELVLMYDKQYEV